VIPGRAVHVAHDHPTVDDVRIPALHFRHPVRGRAIIDVPAVDSHSVRKRESVACGGFGSASAIAKACHAHAAVRRAINGRRGVGESAIETPAGTDPVTGGFSGIQRDLALSSVEPLQAARIDTAPCYTQEGCQRNPGSPLLSLHSDNPK
jgi:hypothetical protein